MSLQTKSRRAVHWWLSAIAGYVRLVVRRIIGTLHMGKRPALFRDWQSDRTAPIASVSPPPQGAPAPPRFDPVEAEGTFIGSILLVSMPPGDIAPLLPAGVTLPPEAAQPSYRHPVNLAVGFQRDVHPDGLDLLPGSNYLECVIGVPDLYLSRPRDGFSGPCATLGRLGLNQLLPVILGRVLGMPKVLARIHTTEDSFAIKALLSPARLAQGRFEPFGAIHQPAEAPEFADIVRAFTQPVVSRSIFGGLTFTKFVWYWDMGELQKVEADVRLEGSWGDGHFVRGASAQSNCQGAWRVRVPWTMQAFARPSQSSDLSRSASAS
ncbi:MAG: hypothetical protein KIT09_09805 [Bryobacteraceae bacterium]|nr:hypothetical protein [Bryobacteraceae bacterium]